MSEHYSGGKLGRSLFHVMTGKAFTAVSTIAVTIVLARALPKADYGVLVVFEAIVALAGALASFGVNQTLLRFLPELRANRNGIAAYRLIRNGLVSRALIFAVILFGMALAAPWLGQLLGFKRKLALFPLFLVGGWMSLSWLLVGQVMESLMWQRSSQYFIALTALMRLILLLAIYLRGEADLERVILIEITCHGLTLMLLLGSFAWRQRHDPERNTGSLRWFEENRKRVGRYAFGGYGVALSTLLYGSQANRAVAARFLAPQAMGDFGFAGSVASLCRRFLPTAVLQGFIRPVYFARFTETGKLHHVERTANLVFRINLVMMCGATLFLLLLGGPIVDRVTAGKYGGTVYLVSAMLGVVVLDSLHQQYALLCQTIERTGLLMASNVALSVSLMLSLPLFASIGAWAIVVANAIGNLVSLTLIRIRLRAHRQDLSLDLRLIASVLLDFGMALAVGHAGLPFIGELAGGMLGLVAFGVGGWLFRPFSADEVERFRGILDKMRFRFGCEP